MRTSPRRAESSTPARNRWAWRCSTTISDGWPDLFVANDTQPNKLYRNLRNGTFQGSRGRRPAWRSARTARRAPAWASTRRTSTTPACAGMAVTNFDNEMMGLLPGRPDRHVLRDVAMHGGVGARLAQHAGLRLRVLRRRSGRAARSDGGQRAHRRHRAQYSPQRRLCAAAAPVPERGQGGRFATWRREAGAEFAAAKSRRAALACGDFDRDGDVDVLITTNSGPACCTATISSPAIAASGSGWSARNRIATRIGAIGADLSTVAARQSRMVKSGSSYLSQSELPVTFGVGQARPRRPRRHRVAERPDRRVTSVAAGKAYECVEGKGSVRSATSKSTFGQLRKVLDPRGGREHSNTPIPSRVSDAARGGSRPIARSRQRWSGLDQQL